MENPTGNMDNFWKTCSKHFRFYEFSNLAGSDTMHSQDVSKRKMDGLTAKFSFEKKIKSCRIHLVLQLLWRKLFQIQNRFKDKTGFLSKQCMVQEIPARALTTKFTGLFSKAFFRILQLYYLCSKGTTVL